MTQAPKVVIAAVEGSVKMTKKIVPSNFESYWLEMHGDAIIVAQLVLNAVGSTKANPAFQKI